MSTLDSATSTAGPRSSRSSSLTVRSFACIRQGIDTGVFIYREGNQVWGKGDPEPAIQVSTTMPSSTRSTTPARRSSGPGPSRCRCS